MATMMPIGNKHIMLRAYTVSTNTLTSLPKFSCWITFLVLILLFVRSFTSYRGENDDKYEGGGARRPRDTVVPIFCAKQRYRNLSIEIFRICILSASIASLSPGILYLIVSKVLREFLCPLTPVRPKLHFRVR